MNTQEFMVWLDGFSEAVTGAPTEAQWKTIKEQMAKADRLPLQNHGLWWQYPAPTYSPTYIPQVTSVWVSGDPTPPGTITCSS